MPIFNGAIFNHSVKGSFKYRNCFHLTGKRQRRTICTTIKTNNYNMVYMYLHQNQVLNADLPVSELSI